MGEYATYLGQQVKIGTCEDMYYLRWDQRHMVTPESGSLDPASESAQKVIRFRFPWPDEDDIAPGGFENHDRHLDVALKLPDGVEHYDVQFTASVGYVMSIPCPEGPGPHAVKPHKNGWRGNVLLRQQAWRAGKLVCVFECGGCGGAFRVEDIAGLADMLAELRKRDNKNGDPHQSTWYGKIADRIEAGYNLTPLEMMKA